MALVFIFFHPCYHCLIKSTQLSMPKKMMLEALFFCEYCFPDKSNSPLQRPYPLVPRIEFIDVEDLFC